MESQQWKARITVGYDGSPSSVTTVEWAANEAELRDAQVCLVHCCSTSAGLGWDIGSSPAAIYDPRELEQATLVQAESMAAELRRRHPGLTCSAEAVPGSPRDGLVDASVTSDLMVVGNTGAGAMKWLLGSVASAVMRRSRCPIVLVPARSTSRPLYNRIVVGVDGSPASATALQWATAEAAVREAELVLIHVWRLPFRRPAIVHEAEREVMAAEAATLLTGLVQSVPTCARRSALRSIRVEDDAETALLAAAESADLVVVGSRGQGGLRSMLFGSVARTLTKSAPCPIAVVHRDRVPAHEKLRPTGRQQQQ